VSSSALSAGTANSGVPAKTKFIRKTKDKIEDARYKEKPKFRTVPAIPVSAVT
jgi:hypothetical protein